MTGIALVLPPPHAGVQAIQDWKEGQGGAAPGCHYAVVSMDVLAAMHRQVVALRTPACQALEGRRVIAGMAPARRSWCCAGTHLNHC